LTSGYVSDFLQKIDVRRVEVVFVRVRIWESTLRTGFVSDDTERKGAVLIDRELCFVCTGT
jgi:hypothetical protein